MMTKKKWVILCTLIVSLSLVGTALARPQAHSINRWVIGGGGGSETSGDTFLGGTVGQWAVGSDTSGSTHLASGFWGGGAADSGEERIFLPLALCQYP
jgi:hypothetical protein